MGSGFKERQKLEISSIQGVAISVLGLSSLASGANNTCNSNPCSSNATCIGNGFHYECSCPVGFGGSNCNIDINSTLPIRLVNGQSYSGRVEVYRNYSWINICHNNFNWNAARVVCRSLGFTNVSTYYCCSGSFGTPQPAPSYMSNINCTGNEISLSQCLYTIANDSSCNRYSTIGIACTVGACGSFPCANFGTCSSTANNGYNCTCSSGWTGQQCESGINECASNPCSANATCVDQHLGYSCRCPQGYYGNNCLNGPVSDGAIRLVNGPNVADGHVQVYHDGRWGFICHYGWDIQDARVVCTQLGYNNASSAGCCSQYGYSFGTYWINNLNCTGSENSIYNCSDFSWSNGTTTCSRYDKASVKCTVGGCSSFPCAHGTCNSNDTMGSSYSCSCHYGWMGQQCDISVNECASNPCVANATCLDRHVSYACLCPEGWYGSNCDQGPVTDGTLRLVAQYNSAGPNEGNVEIYHNGTWGAICHNSFNIKDAQVVCRQLGYTNASYTSCCSNYGNSNYKLTWLSYLNCSGNESRVLDCPRGSRWGDFSNGCGRYSIAGVSCTDFNQCASNPCVNGTCYDQVGAFNCSCFPGYVGTNCNIRSDCYSNPCLNGGTCMVGSSGIGYNCSCINGYTGNECQSDIDECSSSPCASNATCSNLIGRYECNCAPGYVGPFCYESSNSQLPIRLVNGPTPNKGRVEVYHNNVWGSICYYGFNMKEARVACRQLGYTNASGYSCCGTYGYTSGPVWLSNVNCNGTETSLAQCTYIGWNNTGCSTYSNLAITCTVGSCGSFPCVHGTCVSNTTMGGDYNCSCEAGWTGQNCEIEINECISSPCSGNATCIDLFLGYSCKCPQGYYGSNCSQDFRIVRLSSKGPVNDGDLRLYSAYNYGPDRGNVEIYHDGMWGAICHYSWSTNDALVACRQLGYGNVSSSYCCSNFGNTVKRVWLSNVGCSGNESKLTDCPSSGWNVTSSCGRSSYAGVQCIAGSCASYPCVHGTCTSNSTGGYNCSCLYGWTGQQCQMSPVNDGDLRLYSAYNYGPDRGNVEIYHDGMWGAICHYSWSTNDALVACRQLGYGNVSSSYCCSNFGSTVKRVWLSNVGCSGNESKLTDCPSSGWNVTSSCGRSSYAGVQCIAGSCASYPCVHGTCTSNSTSGYSCICSYGWTGQQCQMSVNECASNPCSANATCIDQHTSYVCLCPDGYYGSNCQEGPIADGSVRLVAQYNAAGPNEGNVEIYHNGTWGSICHYSFDINDAQVVCRQLGYPNASRSYCCSYYGNQNYTLMWLSNLYCKGNESRVSDCSRGSGWGSISNG
ncbi:Deleted in malignant brain tumors 1 protein, partial [Trichoplax sp. H2]